MHAERPFPHSPWVRKWEPPFRKAAPPLGEKPFGEAFCNLRVLAQKTLKPLRWQGLSGLGKAENKSATRQHGITNHECHSLAMKWVIDQWENLPSCSPWSPEDGVSQISLGCLPGASPWGVISGHSRCSWQGWGPTHSAHTHWSTRGQSLREEGIWRKQIELVNLVATAMEAERHKNNFKT